LSLLAGSLLGWAAGCAAVPAGAVPAAGSALELDAGGVTGAPAAVLLGAASLGAGGPAVAPELFATGWGVGASTGTLLDGAKVDPEAGGGVTVSAAGAAAAFASFGAVMI
jgi:hypothetical protein